MISAVIERCAGMDVGKKFLAVCVMTGPAAENAQEVRHGWSGTGTLTRVAQKRGLYARGDRLRFTLHLRRTVRYVLDVWSPF